MIEVGGHTAGNLRNAYDDNSHLRKQRTFAQLRRNKKPGIQR